MGNIEQRVEQKQTFYHLKVLDRYILNENSNNRSMFSERKTD